MADLHHLKQGGLGNVLDLEAPHIELLEVLISERNKWEEEDFRSATKQK